MTTVLSEPPQGFVLEDVSWEYYDRTLRELEARHQHVRVTYDDGRMEFMTIGDEHERAKKTIARLIEAYALERDIPITGLGSVTCRRKKLRKGLEPDECYYVVTPAPPIDRSQLDLNKYPPPDLAVEVDITSGSIPRQPIYAALGVREVWRFDGQQIIPMQLTPEGDYRPAEASSRLPELPMSELNRCLQIGLHQSQHEAVKALRDWVRGGGSRT
jgi:Uma2 family endonuclease